MKKAVISLGAVLLVSILACGAENKQKELKPSAENVFVLKHKKRKVTISQKESKNIKPNDIHGIDVKGDTRFFHFPDSIISKYGSPRKVNQPNKATASDKKR
ncbi:MAG: hypothetical protein K2I02_01435 [Duncaniella sp.]|nr:hypothetical protein [Duncaniella sp.]